MSLLYSDACSFFTDFKEIIIYQHNTCKIVLWYLEDGKEKRRIISCKHKKVAEVYM